MRQLAIATALVFAIISPAFAQPFADTPTNHWAYDAIAELAAKGLIEGYPDGTFKGDRAMTRYEMAMVVARLLARIESIQIPTPAPPPKPEVTKKDIDMILRLVNEFRAELAAKNVRLTAVEEELNAIKAKLDNVRITGAYRIREDLNQGNSPGGPAGSAVARTDAPGTIGFNGNPNTSTTDAGNTPRGNRTRQIFRIQFDGSVAPDVHFITVLMSNGRGGSGYALFNSSGFGPTSQFVFGTIDVAFFDWRNAFGWPLEIWVGRFGGTFPGPNYAVQFGPFGLLLNTTSDEYGDSTNNSGSLAADGIRFSLGLKNLADLRVQGVWIRVNGNTGAFTYPSGEDMYGGDVNVQLFPGLRLGGYYVGNSIANAGSAPFSQPAGALSIFYHVYGPAEGGVNPATAHCPTAFSGATPVGITCPALGNGFGAYAQWDIVQGIHLDVEAAQWTDNVLGGSDDAYNVAVTWNLATLLGVGHNLTLTTGYQFAGVNFYAPYGLTEPDGCCWGALYPGNAQAFTAFASFNPVPPVTLYGIYITGNNVSNSQPFTEWEAGVHYNFAPNARITLKYRDLRLNNIDIASVYRAEFNYRF